MSSVGAPLDVLYRTRAEEMANLAARLKVYNSLMPERREAAGGILDEIAESISKPSYPLSPDEIRRVFSDADVFFPEPRPFRVPANERVIVAYHPQITD